MDLIDLLLFSLLNFLHRQDCALFVEATVAGPEISFGPDDAEKLDLSGIGSIRCSHFYLEVSWSNPRICKAHHADALFVFLLIGSWFITTTTTSINIDIYMSLEVLHVSITFPSPPQICPTHYKATNGTKRVCSHLGIKLCFNNHLSSNLLSSSLPPYTPPPLNPIQVQASQDGMGDYVVGKFFDLDFLSVSGVNPAYERLFLCICVCISIYVCM